MEKIVAGIKDLEKMGSVVLKEGDNEILIVRDGENFYAISNICSHQEKPLYGGNIENGEITCPHHGARFSIKTGGALSMPAVEGINVYRTFIRDGSLFVEVPDE